MTRRYKLYLSDDNGNLTDTSIYVAVGNVEDSETYNILNAYASAAVMEELRHEVTCADREVK